MTRLRTTLIVIASLGAAGVARADISDSGNMTIGSWGQFGGTLTVQGNAFSVGGSTFAVTGGLVGIGTTGPHTLLEVGGSGGCSGNLGICLNRGVTTNFIEATDGTKDVIFGSDNSQSYSKIGSLSNTPVQLETNNGAGNYIYISTITANVGLGINTTSPSCSPADGAGSCTALNIGGTEPTLVLGSNSGSLYYNGGDVVLNDFGGGDLMFTHAGTTVAVNGTNNAWEFSSSGNDTNAPASTVTVRGNLSVGNGYTGSHGPQNGAIIQGNVGIGSTNPGYLLDVVSSNPANGIISEIYNNATNGNGAEMVFNLAGQNTWGVGIPSASADFVWVNGRTSSAAGNERMRLTTGGNLGIGSTSPGSTLTVVGTVSLSTASSSSNPMLKVDGTNGVSLLSTVTFSGSWAGTAPINVSTGEVWSTSNISGNNSMGSCWPGTSISATFANVPVWRRRPGCCGKTKSVTSG